MKSLEVSEFDPLKHQTRFITYKSESKDSKLDQDVSLMSAHLKELSKKKRIKSKEGLEEYLVESVNGFLNDKDTGKEESKGKSK